MLDPEVLGAFVRYNRWMNDKLYRLAAKLSDEERKRDLGAFFKSIHGTFNHILAADRIWLARFTGTPIPDDCIGPGIRALNQELYSDFEELRRERARTDDEIITWATQLDPESLKGPLIYKRFGQTHQHTLWWAVTHFFNHQAHHRGQATTLFVQLGHDPGVTDLFAMLRDEAPA